MSAEYKKNSSNGLGIYYFADGSKLLGNFIDNHFDGKGVRVYPDGTWKNEQYNMGKLVNNWCIRMNFKFKQIYPDSKNKCDYSWNLAWLIVSLRWAILFKYSP